METPFWYDLGILIGILPIPRPEKVEFGKVTFLKILSDEEREENRRDTEKLFKLINN